MFGVNDFDKTLPGPYEWDLKRLLASVMLAADSLGIGADDACSIVRRSARRYRQTHRDLTRLGYLDPWYPYVDVAAWRQGGNTCPCGSSSRPSPSRPSTTTTAASLIRGKANKGTGERCPCALRDGRDP